MPSLKVYHEALEEEEEDAEDAEEEAEASSPYSFMQSM